jgi:hypothetical protein
MMPDKTPKAETEIAAIFARLQHEVRKRPATSSDKGTDQTPRAPLAARSRAEQTWAVCVAVEVGTTESRTRAGCQRYNRTAVMFGSTRERISKRFPR